MSDTLAGLTSGGPMPPSLMAGGGAPGPSPAMPPRPNLGPVSQPSANPGNTAAAMLKIKNALHLLQEALPNLPMGDELHTVVLQTVTKLSKVAGGLPEHPGLQQQDLLGMMRRLGSNPMQGALNRMLPSPGAPPAMPAQPG